MSWAPKRKRWDWRAFLTPDERRFITQADRAADHIEELRAAWERTYANERRLTVNRAIHRASYAALRKQEGK